MTRLIALTGYAGTGKSTAAKYLVEQRDYVLVKFAGPLKDMMRALGLSERQIEGDLKEQPCSLLCGQTPRWAMQSLGTEWGRQHIGVNLWVNAAMDRVDYLIHSGRSVVIDDCRFPNEALAVQKAGGRLINIYRAGTEPALGAHQSELNILSQDAAVLNNGTIDTLYERLDAVISAMEGGKI